MPAIDLSDGACVRLYQGDFSAKTVYSPDPVAVAREFREAGAEWLHVVDLDGARAGAAAQTDTLLELARQRTLRLQVGGGVRTAAQIETLLTGGFERILLGSRAVDAPEEVRAWLSVYGSDRLVLAFDVRIRDGVPMPSTRGWQEDGAKTLWDVLSEYDGAGLRHVLCTDIERDGTLEGPNAELYAEIQRRYPLLEILASGGVSSLDDLRTLKKVGVAGVVIGKALYEERFRLSEALRC